MDYIVRYAHSADGVPGAITLDATTDEQAIAAVQRLCADGYRNSTWANIDLPDGRTYGCRNEHGKAICAYV